jgi:DNA-binding response OmpR family regulator
MTKQRCPSKIQRVLLIEKSAYILEALQETMRRSGIELHCAGSAEEGIEAMSRLRFTAVVCNYHLPGMDGLEFYLRTKTLLGGITSILTVSSGDDLLANAARLTGVDYFMEMPFRVEDLLVCLSNGKPSLKGFNTETSFLNSVKTYSIARRALLKAATGKSEGLPDKEGTVRTTQIINGSGGTFRIFHNHRKVSSPSAYRPNLKLIKNRSCDTPP